MIVIVDNGSGASDIARIVRCPVASPKKIPEASGYILSDGDMKNADANKKLIKSAGVPLLAVGNAHVFLVEALGGKAKKVPKQEKQESFRLEHPCAIFLDLKKNFTAYQRYEHAFDEVPENFIPAASSRSYEFEALADSERPFFALRFLPEKGGDGLQVLRNFAKFVAVWEKYHK